MVATGASLTAVMLMVDVAVDTRLPPVPVLPLSFTDSVSVEVADGVSVLSTYDTVEVALVLSRAFTCATVPVMVTDEEPLPETEAPLVPAVTVSVPSVTDRVTVIDDEPASTSAMLSPLFFRLSDTCSVLL